MRVPRVCPLLLAAGALFAQPQRTTPSVVDEGAHLYRTACTLCHGADADLVPGIEMGRGKFRHAYSDDELARIIRDGIPNTAMPPHNLTASQAAAIVAFLRALAADPLAGGSITGDPVRGKALFEGQAQCQNCHRIKGEGARSGPDLSEIGSARRPADLERSILFPDAEIAQQNRMYRVVTKAGATVNGRLLNQDSFTVQLLDSQEQLKSFARSDLRESAFVDKSPMPSYLGKLSPQELADLVGYLASLKAPERPGQGQGRGGNGSQEVR